MKGLKGIVTALHGIADCQQIKILNKKGKVFFEPLTIVQVDIDRDAALLSSSELRTLGDEGFEISADLPKGRSGIVRVYGHPYGIAGLETTLSIRSPELVNLRDLLPPTPLDRLRQRGSPNHLIKVLNLQGTLLPGHSGAPILDAQNRVMAVANGGLKEGFAGISWAVPFEDIDWEGPLIPLVLRGFNRRVQRGYLA